jgi:DNA mismatch repair protein MutL
MINILDQKLVNRIAAGEVIEKPVNVVKELVENAIDAGAKHIIVEVTDHLISVSDDGDGMTKEDLEKCILRHATSKILNYDDLEKVNTFGFRGEALSSIAAVSQMTITTKFKGDIEGFELKIDGGIITSLKPTACSQGVCVEIRDLFYNTPVRKKFLDINENERIVEFLERFALGTSVAIRLKFKDWVVLDVFAQDPLDRIAQVYGIELPKNLVKVDFANEDVKINGYVSKPSLVRKDKSMQALFVNGRLVENEEISLGLYEAYKSLLFVNKHPIVALNLEVKDVDVNVHPTKKIVKFTDSTKITKGIFEAIRNAFREERLEFQVQDNVLVREFMPREMRNYPKEENKRFVREVQKSLGVQRVEEKKYGHFPEMKILGQIAKTFFLAETDEGLLIIDQHVVEERINYEKFMKQYLGNHVAVQDLIMPEVLELGSREGMALKRNIEKLKEYGFHVEEFGENTFRLVKVPVIFSKIKGSELLKDLMVDFKDNEREDIITRMACKRSIKAGDVVSNFEMMNLIKELDKCDYPFTCPHGRPTMVKFPLADLEKLFRRKGF